MSIDKTYPSKILLFGEYSVLLRGSALSIPYHPLYGKWNQSDHSFPGLIHFAEYIACQDELAQFIQVDQLVTEIADGWFLESNIPYGSGLGSSGMVCAAILDRYKKYDIDDIVRLKKILSLMESYFHGNSSGMDPLVSYLNCALKIQDDNIVKVEKQIMLETDCYNIALVDSGILRNTKSQVQLFQTMIQSPKYRAQFIEGIMHFNFQAIEALCQGNDLDLISNWKQISTLSLDLFSSMIPPVLQKIWKKEIDNESSYYKLCGAGGGGFFLNLKIKS